MRVEISQCAAEIQKEKSNSHGFYFNGVRVIWKILASFDIFIEESHALMSEPSHVMAAKGNR